MGPVLRSFALVAFVALSACGGSTSDKPADACTNGSGCTDPCNIGNNFGVGRFCTTAMGECNANSALGSPFLFCTEDYEPDGTGKGFCTGACGSDAECGEGAFCSGSGMGSKGCVPAACGGTPTLWIRAFLFDLDGTLIDSEREAAEAMARVLRAHQGIEVEQYDRDYVIGRSWAAIYDSLKARYPQLTWTREQTIAHTADYRHQTLAESGLVVLPGARALLERTTGQPRALVTGSSRAEVAHVLPHLGHRFDVVVAAEDVPRSKPAPDGYYQAMSALGVTAAECVVVEDSHAGISAGRAAGCITVGVKAGNFGGWDQSHAHLVIDTLDDLTPSLVERLVRDYG